MQQNSSEHTRYDTLITLLHTIQLFTEQAHMMTQAGRLEDAAKLVESVITLTKLAQELTGEMAQEEQ